jgi:short-subunit dehydrogenase
MSIYKTQVFGKNSFFARQDLYSHEIKAISIRESMKEIIDNQLPKKITQNYNEGYKNIIIASGLLLPKKTLEKNFDEIQRSYKTNLILPVLISELLLSKFNNVKILLIGSESGVKGSYDTEYWLSKAALLSYAKERKVKTHQQLNILCPSVVKDSPMTENRHDSKELNELTAPKGRFLSASEVVKLSQQVFKNEYLCNTSINLDGGKFARQNY